MTSVEGDFYEQPVFKFTKTHHPRSTPRPVSQTPLPLSSKAPHPPDRSRSITTELREIFDLSGDESAGSDAGFNLDLNEEAKGDFQRSTQTNEWTAEEEDDLFKSKGKSAEESDEEAGACVRGTSSSTTTTTYNDEVGTRYITRGITRGTSSTTGATSTSSSTGASSTSSTATKSATKSAAVPVPQKRKRSADADALLRVDSPEAHIGRAIEERIQKEEVFVLALGAGKRRVTSQHLARRAHSLMEALKVRIEMNVVEERGEVELTVSVPGMIKNRIPSRIAASFRNQGAGDAEAEVSVPTPATTRPYMIPDVGAWHKRVDRETGSKPITGDGTPLPQIWIEVVNNSNMKDKKRAEEKIDILLASKYRLQMHILEIFVPNKGCPAIKGGNPAKVPPLKAATEEAQRPQRAPYIALWKAGATAGKKNKNEPEYYKLKFNTQLKLPQIGKLKPMSIDLHELIEVMQ